jgi:hypothetical protein
MTNAPAEIVPMLEIPQGLWHWQYFQQNRYRFSSARQQRKNLATILPPDPPRIPTEIDSLFPESFPPKDFSRHRIRLG